MKKKTVKEKKVAKIKLDKKINASKVRKQFGI